MGLSVYNSEITEKISIKFYFQNVCGSLAKDPTLTYVYEQKSSVTPYIIKIDIGATVNHKKFH